MIEIQTYPLSTFHLPDVARVHLASFPESALSCLGREAVRRYYEWLLTGPHDCLAVAVDHGPRLAGFLFGGVFRGAMTGFLARNRAFLAWRLVSHPWLLANPKVLDRLGVADRLLRKKMPARQSPGVIQPRKSFAVLAIAVDPAVQKKGLGKALMDCAEQKALELGYLHMHLSVATDNAKAIRFYENLGWVKEPADPWEGHMSKVLAA